MDRYRPRPTWIDHALRALAIVIGVSVAVLSLGPPPSSESMMSDKYAHFLSYLSFTYCALLGFIGRPGRPPLVFRVAFALAAMIAAARPGIELLQILVGRDTSLMDALANAAGASLAWAVWILTVRRSPREA
jgi:VanZ family protein